jgi:ABC-2 type transport system permease protein
VVSLIRAELRKVLGLPTAGIGLALGVLLSPLVVLINAPAVRRGGLASGDTGLVELGIGLIGPMILGVVIVSSELTSTGDDAPRARQLTATLLAAPRRLRLLTAKTAALMLLVALQASVAVAATVGLTHALHGDQVPVPAFARLVAAVVYWVLLALLAYSITLIARNGIVPLTFLIVNSTFVSFSYLLTKVTKAAAYLPDIVGAQMFLRGGDFVVRIPPVTAGLVMSAWIAAFLAAGALFFHRRDA